MQSNEALSSNYWSVTFTPSDDFSKVLASAPAYSKIDAMQALGNELVFIKECLLSLTQDANPQSLISNISYFNRVNNIKDSLMRAISILEINLICQREFDFKKKVEQILIQNPLGIDYILSTYDSILEAHKMLRLVGFNGFSVRLKSESFIPNIKYANFYHQENIDHISRFVLQPFRDLVNEILGTFEIEFQRHLGSVNSGLYYGSVRYHKKLPHNKRSISRYSRYVSVFPLANINFYNQ